MNRIKSVVLLCFMYFSLIAFAQDRFSSYENSYYGKQYDIVISLKATSYSLWINAISLEDSAKVGGIVVREKNFFNFLESLKMAKLKYDEYSNQAKKIGVKHEDKNMRIFNSVDVFTVAESKYVYSDIPLNFDFKVRQNDNRLNYLLFISADQYNIVFTSSAEIQDFIDKFSSVKINEYVAKNQNIEFLSPLIVSETKPLQLSKNGFFSKITLGVKGTMYANFGMNDVNFENFNSFEVISSFSNNSKTLGLGVFAQVFFGKLFFQPELSYQMGRIDNKLLFYDFNIQSLQTINSVKLSKLDVPLLIGYNIYETSKSGLKILVGANLLFNIGTRMDFPYYSPGMKMVSNKIESKIDPYKIGFVGGLAFDLNPLSIGARFNFIKDSNHTRAIVDNLNGTYSQNVGDLSANTFEFSLGWKIFYPQMNK